MGALPIPEPVAPQCAVYIEELREFLDTYDLPHGSPDDVITVADRLYAPGPFAGDLSLVIRSILLSEGGSMPRVGLLKVLALAIGGPQMEHAPREYAQALQQLFSFLNEVRPRPVTIASKDRGQLIPFPASAVTSTEVPATPDPPVVQEFPRPVFEFHLDPLPEPATIEQDPSAASVSEPPSAKVARSLRNLLIAATVAVILALLLVFILQPRHARQTALRPVSRASSIAKPSAYGKVLVPVHPRVRRHPAVAGTTVPNPQPGAGADPADSSAQ